MDYLILLPILSGDVRHIFLYIFIRVPKSGFSGTVRIKTTIKREILKGFVFKSIILS